MDAAGNPQPAVRIHLLRRLAEQAMDDEEFREAALADLDLALERYGYDLNPPELALVRRFRASLADAGIDLDIVRRLSDDQIRRLLR